MPGSCAVVGCRNRFVRGGKHFYRFPKNEQFKNLWIQFTRKGNNFDVKKCSAVCEDHFSEDRVVVKKKGRLYLIKKTVPTIYYRDAKEGIERVVVEFDENTSQYIGEESVNLLRGTVSAQEEKTLVHDRRQKIKELKNLCRFCFESQDERFVAVSKLEAYSIDPGEMLTIIGIGPQYNEVFSEIVCEQCFQQIVAIDGYRKRCRKAQEDIINEMQELDQKLQSIRNLKTEERPWFKDDEMFEEEPQNSHIEIIEEHLDDNISYVGDEDEDFKMESFDNQDFETYSNHLIVKDEEKVDNAIVYVIDQSEGNCETSYENHDEEDEDDEENFFGMTEQADKDIYHISDIDAIIKNPERNSFALRVYECFFCRLVRFFKVFNK